MSGPAKPHNQGFLAIVNDAKSRVKQMNIDYLMNMRRRFVSWIEDILAKYPPAIEVVPADLADLLNVIVEGAIIQSKALKDPGLMGRQTRLYRNHVKLLFGA